MAARAHAPAQLEAVERVSSEIEPATAIAKLARLRTEAEETARLANLLGRSLYTAIILPVLGALTIGLAEGMSLSSQLVWGGFVALGAVAMLRSYAHTISEPFERPALKSFAKDLSAILLYNGFAWGAGAFLALPTATGMAAAILFAIVPAAAVALLLREREAVFLFLAPVATLASFASVLRPFADGALDAALILVACAVVAGLTLLIDRRATGDFVRPAMLPLT
ncbi:MAG: hypothetical protein KGJ79_07865 [Alphaproteobacteria bacterium]|nr:hypothetical protein [Alphaproteobacteria bacterium]MDE2111043.1 hypothetical protein [Alphaproteobacteria bacterium]MDE2494743.1 hypothetical protein [Alphaproteobacteria bacterium]